MTSDGADCDGADRDGADRYGADRDGADRYGADRDGADRDLDADAAALAERLGQLLEQRRGSIAVAESLTGGLLVQALARVEGSGEWLLGGVVAYASSVKHELLGVTAEKVVSRRAAEEMATGVRARLGADIAVAVTGAAGPDSQDGEPPGTVWIGVDDGVRSRAELYTTDGSPTDVCERTVVEAIRHVMAAIDGRDVCDDGRPGE
jgi:nicotinamide-nucleotide amidase